MIKAVVDRLCRDLRAGTLDGKAVLADTRPIHEEMFVSLTPPNEAYYAGNYRGSDHRCLKRYDVRVLTAGVEDSYVGFEPNLVTWSMNLFATEVEDARLRAELYQERTDVSAVQKAKVIVALAGAVLEFFLRIHPYADGNGHAGRFLLWAFLSGFGYWPERCTIEPKPATRVEYCAALNAYRAQGDPVPLERWIYDCLEPAPSNPPTPGPSAITAPISPPPSS